MRGPQVKTPLLLLLLLVTSLNGTDYDDDKPEADAEGEAEAEAEPEAEPEPEPEDEAEPEPEPEAGQEQNEETDGDTDITDHSTLESSPTEDSPSEPVEGSTPHDSGETRRMDPGISNYVPDTSSLTTEHQPTESSSSPPEELSLITILIPVVLAVLIAGMIVLGIFINRHWKKKVEYPEQCKEDPYLEGSSTEKVPMPMFEEDVPSVLELEMEELDQWMKKDY